MLWFYSSVRSYFAQGEYIKCINLLIGLNPQFSYRLKKTCILISIVKYTRVICDGDKNERLCYQICRAFDDRGSKA